MTCPISFNMVGTMPNSADLMLAINELVNSLARHRNAQLRADARYCYGMPVQLGSLVGGSFRPSADGFGLDLSLQGMGLMLEGEVMPGKQMTIQFKGMEDQVFQIPIRVVHSEPMFKQITRVGVMFLFD